MIVCFVTTGTTRHPPRSVILRGLPLRVDVGEGKGFWAAVQKAASRSKTDVQTHMESIAALAYSHMNSSKTVDRDDAIQALVLSMETTGLFTLVLGGKNLGKTFLKKTAVAKVWFQRDGPLRGHEKPSWRKFAGGVATSC